MTILRPILAIALLNSAIPGLSAEPPPAVVVRLDHPDRQALKWISLFRGARVPHPAAALVAWKRASAEPDRLGKPAEALIAAINPAMAGELRTLDGAELALRFEPEADRPTWGLSLPEDDGTFAALETSLVLSGGAAGATPNGPTVDRLGPPGSPWMTRGAHALLMGGSLEALQEARLRSDRPRTPAGEDRLRFEIEPGALESSRSIGLRRLNILQGQARGSISGSLGLDGSTLKSSLNALIESPSRPAPVDPRWLDRIPADRASAAFALAVDSTPAIWDATFRLADRVEKADPAFANTASVRLRLNLLARSFGLRIEEDVLSHLRGITGWIGSDGRSVDRAVVTFHLDGEAIADRIFDRIKPIPNPEPPRAALDPIRQVGQVGGRAIRVCREGASIAVSWGEGTFEAVGSARVARGPSFRELFQDRPAKNPHRYLAAIWPSRIPGLVPAESPLAKALSGASPIVWSGSQDESGLTRLEGTWDGLDAILRRFLDAIPLDPPPDR